MAKISTYPNATPSLSDKVIGTNVTPSNETENFLLSDVLALFVANLPPTPAPTPLQYSLVLNAKETLALAPSALDTPLQLTIGPAQLGSSDPVQLLSTGEIRFNQAGQYWVSAQGLFERLGSSGGFALLHFRALINGVQFGNTQSVEIDKVTTWIPYERSIPIYISTPGTELSFQIVRDSTGVNAGGLYPAAVSTPGWPSTPSFAIQVYKSSL
jgi:hypothetical protein